ncbi:Dipeptidyl aminopeptidase [Phaffia rhodozyma]|uniref:Dipeptidyl aminopeptidase n=1 Tax=Phaffia rhodozyma TaxID=264483 RepID=A0A0F7SLK7_PHARH|nr:Dipeptidyl aminopeptidase [Phaffia rhodozyma]
MSIKAPFGSWDSPISADLITQSAISFGEIASSLKYTYHTEGRASEGGREVIVRTPLKDSLEEKAEDVYGPEFNARSRVHEYGGGAFHVIKETDEVFFINFSDSRVYSVKPGGSPTPITKDLKNTRYSSLKPHPLFSTTHPYLLAIQEVHEDPVDVSKVYNSLALIDVRSGETKVLQSGADFYSSPRWAPDGVSICWILWNHPNMPWEDTQLWTGQIEGLGEVGAKVINSKRITSGEETAVSQPTFSEDGKWLYFVWDKTGFSILYRVKAGSDEKPELAMEKIKSDIVSPAWRLDSSRYVLLSDKYALITPSIKSIMVPHLLDLITKTSTPIPSPFVVFSEIRRISSTSVLLVGLSATKPSRLAILTFPTSYDVPGVKFTTVKSSAVVDEKVIPPGTFSEGKGLEFDIPGAGNDEGKTVNLNVLFYPPKNARYAGGNDGEKPPAIVSIHGGPTSQSLPGHQWRIQYYTSRGFAFVDVNYGGSSGYGRDYINRLRGNWGVVDVSDTIEAVKACTAQGLIDGKRVAIIGGSAGGFTVLAALTKSDVFAVGISSYGIGDIKLLADGTHKFESQYLFKLVGGTPEEIPEIYHDRSPAYHAQNIKASLLLLQGLDDKVVPPEQAQDMARRVEAAGGKVEAVYYEGEGHGFRQAKNIKDSLERSLSHMRRAFL